jgi:endo-1,4-beta-xylanase
MNNSPLNFKHVLMALVVSGAIVSCTNNKTNQLEQMSEAYWEYWNPNVQARIDKDIEQHRKADAVLKMGNVSAGTEVKIEQVSHDFIFGANIFNFNQLGSKELNQKYKDLFGTLFNSATIPFYWKKFEIQPESLRFKAEYWDTEEYWNQVEEPNSEPHWRRPAPEPVLEFCESKGIRKHGHPITWGNKKWHYPEWIYENFCPEDEKDKIISLGENGLDSLTPWQIADLTPVYCSEINRLFRKRIIELAEYYGDRLDSWDVVNESATDYENERLIPGDKICKSVDYGLMPGNYAYETFKLTTQLFPDKVLMNINDYISNEYYANEVIELMKLGCKVDIIGYQMHLFNPQQCIDIAEGKLIRVPEDMWNDMKTISRPGLPIHVSEITITSPGDDARGREIQAIISRNMYRLWFSIEQVMGITWWNIVDGCGAPGEPTVSGLFTRNMEPKPAYFALNKLINDEWKTCMTVNVDENGTVKFRGFRGQYIVSWKDKDGKEQKAEFYLKNDGDGI